MTQPLPTLGISVQKVVEMHNAYIFFSREMSQYDDQFSRINDESRVQIIRGVTSHPIRHVESYIEFTELWNRLSFNERVSLNALAYFARESQNWVTANNYAERVAQENDPHYQMQLGRDWLWGLLRHQASLATQA